MIKSKKMVCILLALCMLVALLIVGCSKKEDPDATTTKADATTTKTAATTTQAEELEVVDVLIGQWSFTFHIDNPEGVANDPILNYLEDKFKMEFEWTTFMPDDYQQVLSLWLATDSSPDLWEASLWPVLQDNWDEWTEVLLDMSGPVFAAPDRYPILNDIFNDPNYKFANAISNFDADNYSSWLFASPARPNVARGMPAYRMEYMENLGRDFPETLDEFIDLLRAFVNEDPDQNGEDDTYGLTLPMYTGNNLPLELDPLFFRTQGSEINGLHEAEDGSWYNATISPKNKEIWKKLQGWFAEGLFDKEYITRAGVGIDTEGFVAGKSGAMSERFPNGPAGSQYTNYVNLFLEGNPGFTWKDIQLQPTPLVGPNGDTPKVDSIEFTVGRKMMIAGNTEVPERMMDLIEYLFCSREGMMLRSFGIEGVHYTLDGDDPNDENNVVLNFEQHRKDISGVYYPNEPTRYQWTPFFRGVNGNQQSVWYDEHDNNWLEANTYGVWAPDYSRVWDDHLSYIREIHDLYFEQGHINFLPAYNWAATGLIPADVKDEYDAIIARQKDLELEYFNGFFSNTYNVDEKWDEFVSKYNEADPNGLVIKTWTKAVDDAKLLQQ